jgi:hypothetical protein
LYLLGFVLFGFFFIYLFKKKNKKNKPEPYLCTLVLFKSPFFKYKMMENPQSKWDKCSGDSGLCSFVTWVSDVICDELHNLYSESSE